MTKETKITAQEARETLENIIDWVINPARDSDEKMRESIQSSIRTTLIPMQEAFLELINDKNPDLEELEKFTDDVPAYMEFAKEAVGRITEVIEKYGIQSD